ncbi:sulfurtransferase [Niallia sp. 03133]|uniref:sulfurtransferase n=1 Tax=Niallia sp. 03133 TaxID=3458060 RepID=UPI004043E552
MIILNFVVDPEWLLNNYKKKDVRVLDCRFNLADPEEGSRLFEKNHIPQSIYFDLEEDMSSPVKKHGGRHPLPDIQELKTKFEEAGIDGNTKVVAYDNGEGAYAARMWWLLTYLGHKQVYVLNGGYKGWLEKKYPTTAEKAVFNRSIFPVHVDKAIMADYKEIYEIVQSDETQTVLIDSREYKRYIGEIEPIDKKCGHIPGAINKVWTEGTDNGYYLSEGEQKKRFSDLDSQCSYIVYCGSGVTAAPNFLALKMAGFEKVKLYPGSFSDWISYEDNKVETKK